MTGASSGLGRAFVDMLLSEGVSVWGTSRDVSRLSSFADSGKFTAVALDLADALAAENVFLDSARAAGGVFDLVINNAGYGLCSPFIEGDFQTWHEQVETVLLATARISHASLRLMAPRNRGCLVHVSSLASEFPLPYMSGYNMAKAGISALSESLIFETRGTGITVIDFRPGDYRTDFNNSMQTRLPLTGAVKNEPRLETAWSGLEKHLKNAPDGADAARDMRCALLRSKSGIVRSGSFFQATVAPLFARCISENMRRFIIARYYGLT